MCKVGYVQFDDFFSFRIIWVMCFFLSIDDVEKKMMLVNSYNKKWLETKDSSRVIDRELFSFLFLLYSFKKYT